jgi:nucleoside-diphosphate-sugar epimerase
MKIAITGGAGYVGSVLVRSLLSQGYSVSVIDNLRYGGHGLLDVAQNPNFQFHHGDIRNRDSLKKAIESCEIIIHLAALVGYPVCDQSPEEAVQVNVDATRLLNEVRDISQGIIFPSSLSSYGDMGDQLCTELTQPKPITLYGKTKLDAEQSLLTYDNVIVFRPATAFGYSPRLRLDLMVNDFVYKASTEGQLTIYEPNFKRCFVHVADFASALLFAIENFDSMKNNVYNLGSNSLNMTKKRLAEIICAKTGADLIINTEGTDPDRRDYRVEFQKLSNVGYKPEFSLEHGIHEIHRAATLLQGTRLANI